ncbi:MAG: sugar ABC transporter ATP-binding protein, partial [Candidatus Eisenbacteria bacterium]|nr:sugar ABC transporter ATP-binding protein [Candidatus Eisenbacteria bacterium]
TKAEEVLRQETQRLGFEVRDPSQPAGTLSGGERQTLAIARAVYFGAELLILDEPTSALGVAQKSQVLRQIDTLRKQNLAIILITHNVRDAYAVGDRFTILERGQSMGTYKKSEISRDELQEKMAGGKELVSF